ncbi:YafY family protein [uncultured Brevibacillus sp.]|uniref:helix-turn-helix transcriptional regulator n=1 Tax=uncultured Brevibacillus sp. TaxID=169970 RepID=UPI002591EF5C|nr:YafY family protein [uncultured Brevibacillus sp.]
MNKTDRLLAIVLELQRKQLLRAEDLAETFETSVRTIYRDMQALSEAGVPIVGSPGLGYSLMEGYFLPPVSFSIEEAVTLLIGTSLVEQTFDPSYGEHAKSSQRKLESLLSEPVRQETARVRSTFRLLSNCGYMAKGQAHEYMETLRQAILNRQKVRFRYKKSIPEADGNRDSVRDVAPYGLVLMRGSWILLAQCDLRQDIRNFRLSRMSGLTVLNEHFMCPADFDLESYRPKDDRKLLVRLQISSAIVDKVKESYQFFIEEIAEHPEAVIVTLRVRQIEEIIPWVLGWGAQVAVLEPDSLRTRIREEAEKMLEHYFPSPNNPASF